MRVGVLGGTLGRLRGRQGTPQETCGGEGGLPRGAALAVRVEQQHLCAAMGVRGSPAQALSDCCGGPFVLICKQGGDQSSSQWPLYINVPGPA